MPLLPSRILKVAVRVLLLSLLLAGTYHLDTLVDRCVDPAWLTPTVQPAEDAGRWNRLLARGENWAWEKGGELLKTLLYYACKLLWPFLFAALAVPLTLPRGFAQRNWWALGVIAVCSIVIILLYSQLHDDFGLVWQNVKRFQFEQLAAQGDTLTRLKWGMAVVAIELVTAFTLAYRLLSRVKMEQLLYFFLLLFNAVYIIMPDFLIGEIDDVFGVIVSMFLALAVWIDRLMTTTSQ